MSSSDVLEPAEGEGEVVYCMTIRLRNGKVIRRANGRPFRFVVKTKCTVAPE